MATPTTRTLEFMRDAGWYAEKTEHWNPFAKIRKDLLGFGDIIALPKEGMSERSAILVQACAAASHSARRDKILASPLAPMWIRTGGQIWLISWGKRGARGQRKVWCPRVENITFELEEQPLLKLVSA